MKKYKVLKVENDNVFSSFKNYYYGKLNEVIGKELICEEFDSRKDVDCSNGFYATGIDGLIYRLNRNKLNRVFEVEVRGKSVISDKYKQRFEKQTIIRMLPKSEVRKLIKEQSKTMDWDYYHACYPVNPLKINKPFDKEKALVLLKQWDSVKYSVWNSVVDSVVASVRDSVWNSVRASVGGSVGGSVWGSVEESVRDSVVGSVVAYISSLFPKIKKWKYVDHEKGINPFQSGIDLWNMGLIPSFDGNVWRLHKGKKAEIVLEITQKELRR